MPDGSKRATVRNIGPLGGANAPSRGQFAKQFRLENERVRSTGHYVTRTDGRTDGRRRGCGRAEKTAAEGGSENDHKSSPSLSSSATIVGRDGIHFVTHLHRPTSKYVGLQQTGHSDS